MKTVSKELVQYLDHFLNDSGHVLRVTPKEAKDIQKELPFLEVGTLDDVKNSERTYFVRMSKDAVVPNEIAAEYWEMKYKALKKETFQLVKTLKTSLKDIKL